MSYKCSERSKLAALCQCLSASPERYVSADSIGQSRSETSSIPVALEVTQPFSYCLAQLPLHIIEPCPVEHTLTPLLMVLWGTWSSFTPFRVLGYGNIFVLMVLAAPT